MAAKKLFEGEQCLIQTVDKKIILTTHRLMKSGFSWAKPRKNSIMLEDIVTWEIKQTGTPLYLGLSIAMALTAYFDNSFALFSGFFLILYLMTRYRKIHIRTHDSVMVLPMDVVEESSGINVLIDTVRVAQRDRLEQLKKQMPVAA
ncbi:hypothetical protein GCM10023188_24490 [Pontibacter saemangeumensis]|uniref:Uncharacterized protein n=1 Tax=Pontibacter saemangeumensis TaxID=1084525 RepID=A0ABP8LS52_9BACT